MLKNSRAIFSGFCSTANQLPETHENEPDLFFSTLLEHRLGGLSVIL
jgi:hypothetical protein